METTCIIAVRNGASFLKAALDSVLGQNICPDEVLVVDDGSTDTSADIAKNHVLRPRVMNSVGRGPAAARNTALNVAKGRFIAFLDADDLWHPNKLERQFQEFERDPDLGLCFSASENIADPPVISSEDWRTTQLGNQKGNFLLSTTLARRSLFDKVGMFDESLFPWGEDTDWFLRVVAAKIRIKLIADVLVDRRLHDSNLTRSFASPQRIDTAFSLLSRDLARRRGANKQSLHQHPQEDNV